MNATTRMTVVLLLVGLANLANAQQQDGVPSAVVESWSYLIGDWQISGRVGSASLTGSATFEWVEGKHCYLGRQDWRVGDAGRLVRLTLLGGWNAAEKATVEQGFSSSGDAATVYYQPAAPGGNVIEGDIDGASGPDARWSGTVQLERKGPDEFQLTTTIEGEVRHSLKYTRKKDARDGGVK